jgi:uncharacterized protein YjlB
MRNRGSYHNGVQKGQRRSHIFSNQNGLPLHKKLLPIRTQSTSPTGSMATLHRQSLHQRHVNPGESFQNFILHKYHSTVHVLFVVDLSYLAQSRFGQPFLVGP